MSMRAALRGVLAFAVALGLLSSIGLAHASAGLYGRDLYFRAGYEHQIDSRTCTAASTAMMLNYIAGRDLNLNQAYILNWEKAHDALKDSVQRGSDPLGWSRAMTYFSWKAGRGSFTYRWEAYSSEYIALKRAAKVIAYTGKPVGLLVQHGKHAVVMTGFESNRDPRSGDFTLVNVWVSDPIGYTHRKYAASESPLNTYLELDATATYDEAWYGRYVIVPAAI